MICVILWNTQTVTATQKATELVRPPGQQPSDIVSNDNTPKITPQGQNFGVTEGAMDGQGNIIGDEERVCVFKNLSFSHSSLLLSSPF